MLSAVARVSVQPFRGEADLIPLQDPVLLTTGHYAQFLRPVQ